MKKLEAKVSLYDNSVFLWQNGSTLEGLISIHVDDFEYCGISCWYKANYVQNQKEEGSFRYVELNIEQNGDEIFVIQQAYVDGLEENAIGTWITLSQRKTKRIKISLWTTAMDHVTNET